MNDRRPYSPPTITEEDEMEQTALQTCWVTEAYDATSGNFVAGLCTNSVEKGGAFNALADCATLWPGALDNKTAEPFS